MASAHRAHSSADPLAEGRARRRPPTRGVLFSLKKDRSPAVGYTDEP